MQGPPRGFLPPLTPVYSRSGSVPCIYPTKKGANMTKESYEAPQITVLGEITDMTQAAKPGIYFDFPGSAEGNKNPPAPDAPGTTS